MIQPDPIRIGGPLCFAYDLFLAAGRIVLIGPLEQRMFERLNIDINGVVARSNGETAKGEVVTDAHGHTLVIEFPFQSLREPCTAASVEVEFILNDRIRHRRVVTRRPTVGPGEICLATLQKDETFLLEPWINYHLSIGVGHIFIYDNNSKKIGDIQRITAPYTDAGVVTLIHWPYPKRMRESGISGQTTQQNHSLYTNRDAGWIGLIDVDEFLVPKRNDSLKEFLQPFAKVRPEVGALSIQSAWFGCNNGVGYTQSDFPFKLNRRSVEYEGENARQKVLAVPGNIRMFSVHKVVDGLKTIHVDPELISINHYYVFSSRKRGCDHSRYDQVADDRIRQLILQNNVRLTHPQT